MSLVSHAKFGPDWERQVAQEPPKLKIWSKLRLNYLGVFGLYVCSDQYVKLGWLFHAKFYLNMIRVWVQCPRALCSDADVSTMCNKNRLNDDS